MLSKIEKCCISKHKRLCRRLIILNISVDHVQVDVWWCAVGNTGASRQQVGSKLAPAPPAQQTITHRIIYQKMLCVLSFVQCMFLYLFKLIQIILRSHSMMIYIYSEADCWMSRHY